MTQLRKAILRVHWHDGALEDIEVQYNPTEYSLDKSAQIAEVQIPGLDSPLQQYVRGQTEKLTVEFFFDTTDQGMGAGAISVTRETDKIYQLVKIEPTRHAPPICDFIWADQFPGSSIGSAGGGAAAGAGRAISGVVAGAAAAVGSALAAAGSVSSTALAGAASALGSQRRNGFSFIVETIKQKFTLFSPEGVPLRATLTCTLREYKTLQDQIDQLRLSSPDRTHVHVLQQGESLAAVARRYYDTPRDWRAVAAANGIDDVRRLVPGAVLTVPPLV